jgi:histidinol dehydrogenase
VVSYSQAGLAAVARDVEVFADAEDLPAHGAAVSRRFPA